MKVQGRSLRLVMFIITTLARSTYTRSGPLHHSSALAFLSRPTISRRPKSSQLHTSVSELTTPYTITCPPTDSATLYRKVSNHVVTFDRFLAQKPVVPHTALAFQVAYNEIELQTRQSIILDSGCGTGRSALVLGESYPDSIVLGVDRSIVRLERNQAYSRRVSRDQTALQTSTIMQKSLHDELLVQQVADNVWLIRAELVDFWRCAHEAGLTFDRHYMLYPNPYPKKSRLQSRWYAHSSFPLLLQISPCIIMRSNWKLYLEEMATAIQMADQVLSSAASQFKGNESLVNYARPFLESTNVEPRLRLPEEPSWTNFEEKYSRAGEPTFEVQFHH